MYHYVLKQKISLDEFDDSNYDNWFRYVFTCFNRGIELNCWEEYFDFFRLEKPNIEMFYSYVETSEAPINQVTCQYFRFARVEIQAQENPMASTKLGFCTNIVSIYP